jgi:hypothetical protein
MPLTIEAMPPPEVVNTVMLPGGASDTNLGSR